MKATLCSLIIVGYGSLLESMLIFMMRVNVSHIYFQPIVEISVEPQLLFFLAN